MFHPQREMPEYLKPGKMWPDYQRSPEENLWITVLLSFVIDAHQIIKKGNIQKQYYTHYYKSDLAEIYNALNSEWIETICGLLGFERQCLIEFIQEMEENNDLYTEIQQQNALEIAKEKRRKWTSGSIKERRISKTGSKTYRRLKKSS